MLRGISKLRVALVLQHGYAGTLHDVALSVLFFVFQASSFDCECCFPHWFPTFLRLQWGICIGLPGWCWTVAYVLLPISSAYGFATSERCQLGVSLALSDSWFVLPFNQNVEPKAQPNDFLPPLTQSTHQNRSFENSLKCRMPRALPGNGLNRSLTAVDAVDGANLSFGHRNQHLHGTCCDWIMIKNKNSWKYERDSTR